MNESHEQYKPSVASVRSVPFSSGRSWTQSKTFIRRVSLKRAIDECRRTFVVLWNLLRRSSYQFIALQEIELCQLNRQPEVTFANYHQLPCQSANSSGRKFAKMAIAFKPPEIPTIGNYHHQYHNHQQTQSTPPPSPNGGSVAVHHHVTTTNSDVSTTVTDSVPRTVVVQHQQPIIVPQSVVFHPIPPIFLFPQLLQSTTSIQSPPPSPVLRVVGPRQSCPPTEGCRICQDIQRGKWRAVLCGYQCWIKVINGCEIILFLRCWWLILCFLFFCPFQCLSCCRSSCWSWSCKTTGREWWWWIMEPSESHPKCSRSSRVNCRQERDCSTFLELRSRSPIPCK